MSQPQASGQALRAPLDIAFDYTRSLGPTLSAFASALAEGRILGARSADGRVYAPPFEYDPVTSMPPTELVEVGPGGTVVTWSWMEGPLDGQPLDRPFGWALIQLDGADTAMLHAVDAGSADRMRSGMRVAPRWSDHRGGGITDIACFEPEHAAADSGRRSDDGEQAQVTIITTPIKLSYEHTVSPGENSFLRGLESGRLIAQRCPACGKVYLPPRGACPTCGVPTEAEVELPDTGIVTTFCVVNVPFVGQQVPVPYVAASVLVDGADIAIQHLILGCEPDEVRTGMRVRAVWKPPEEWTTSMRNIDHFEPTGEPDAPYDSYAHHL